MIGSKLELWRVEVKGHLSPEDYLFARAADDEGKQLLLLRLQLNLQFVAFSQLLVLQIQIVNLKCDLFNVGVFVQLVLVEDGDSSVVVQRLNAYIDLLTLNLPLLYLGRLAISHLLQLCETVLLHQIKLNFRRIGIVTVALFVHLQLNYLFLVDVQPHGELILSLLVDHLDVLLLFQKHSLAEVVVLQ